MRDLHNEHLAFIDVETTGLSASKGDRIIEIAILRTHQGQITHSYNQLINPQCSLNPRSAAVHGIQAHTLQTAPTFSHILADIEALLTPAILVGHNVSFDINFLHHEFLRAGKPLVFREALDTLPIARRHFDFPKNNLATIATSLGFAHGQLHRALADVELTQAIFWHFSHRLELHTVQAWQQAQSAPKRR